MLEEIMLKRRSIRKYTNKLVEEEKIQKLLEYAMSAPSAMNRQPWEFYVVTNEKTLEDICNAGRFTKHLSPLKIVVCGDKNRFLPKELESFWIQDCSAAIENILLGVTELGLGACWEGVYPHMSFCEKLIPILNLPENHIALGVISIGYPDEEQAPRTQYDENKVHYIK